MNLKIKNLYDDNIFFASAEETLTLKLGDLVVFQPKDTGLQVGSIITLNAPKADIDDITLGNKIERKINKEDQKKLEENAEAAEQCLEKARAKILEMSINMKITEARFSFDTSELNFFFTASERVDFREVVPKLAGAMQKRIHLTQLGIRDRAKICGGFGICGREQCCSNGIIHKFRSVTMDMVKTQELAGKNSEKLSGPCGKLLCCLAYELEEYEKMRKQLPSWGSQVKTSKGAGKIISLDVLNQKIKVLFEKGGTHIFGINEINF
jgi:cell fate regulator YaaT (PSP1 superfamily)